MNATPPTARELFAEILKTIPREQWDGRLAEIRRQDGALADRVEQLLHAHLEPQSFLDKPLAATVSFTDNAAIGEQIGPYKLREQIGEGGFGVVYVAEQERPIRRKVALKVIKPGMDSREIIARFEAERQALALMDHPNIARVLDAGATGAVEGQRSRDKGQESHVAHPSSLISHPSSRPFFVMELVRGVPITDFCDRERLTTAERLRLLVDVCRAVQHAHQKGIIHRDLKPSNVLVTLHDGRPVLKVIDFGVAKALSQQLTEHTLYTAMGQMVGTPMYMSPEQAELSGLDVDTRSDVYSLGVLLYELLTGTTPFDKETLKKAGFEEFRRIVREMEPVRPSARISTLKDDHGETISDQRRVDVRRLAQSLRGDLDWVVMKALEKDRNRRYATASDLADDIERYLANQPVEAGPPSTLYRARKYVSRNKLALSAGSIVLASMIGATGFSVSYAIQADQARAAAEAAKKLANDRLGLLEAEQRKLQEEQQKLRQSKELTARNFGLAKDAVAELIDNVAQHRLAAFPELAALREMLLTTADDFYSKLLADSPDDPELLVARGGVRQRLDRHAEALEDYLHAAWLRPADPVVHGVLGEFYRNCTRLDARDRGLALEHAQRAVEVSPDNADAWFLLGWTQYHALGNLDEASKAMRRAGDLHSTHVAKLFCTACALEFEGSLGQAAEAYREAIRAGHLAGYLRRGVCLQALKQYDEAIACYTDAIRIDAYNYLAHVHRGFAYRERAQYADAVGDWERALELAPHFDDFVADLFACYLHLQDFKRAATFLEGRDGRSAFDSAIVECNRAAMQNAETRRNERLARAWEQFAERTAACPRSEGDLHVLAQYYNRRANSFRRMGQPDEAMNCYRIAIKANPASVTAHVNLGVELAHRGNRDEAIDCYRKAIELDPGFAAAHYNLGNDLRNCGDFEGAIAAWRRALELKPDLQEAHCNLGLLLLSSGDFAAGLAALRRGHELGSRNPNWPYASAQWVRKAERLIELDHSFTEFLSGTWQPADAAERLELANFALVYQHDPLTAAPLYLDALAADPSLAADLRTGHRYNAVCAAALASTSSDTPNQPLTDADRAAWRAHARDWLTADLDACQSLGDANPAARSHIAQTLAHWQSDPNLSSVRDPEPLARLPETEQQQWQDLWQRVEQFRASVTPPPEESPHPE